MIQEMAGGANKLQIRANKIADVIKDNALKHYSDQMHIQASQFGVHKEDIAGWLGDLKDILLVIHLLEYGEFKKAWSKANSLDTAVRDELPMDALYSLSFGK